MEINEFLDLEENAQKDYVVKLSNEEFNSFIQNVKKKNLKLSMSLSSFRQSNKNMNKNEEEKITENKLELYKIKNNPEQPRKIFSEEQVVEKMESIRNRGLITPITVFKKDNEYILIAGQLRLEAFKRLNQEERINNIPSEKMLYSKIDVYIKENENYSNIDIAIDSLIENLNRADMNFVDTAMAIKRVLDEEKVTFEELGTSLGKSKFFVSSYNTIANADKDFLDYLREKEINQPTIVYKILQLNKSIDEKKKLVDLYINGELKKTQLQEMVKEQNESKPKEIVEKNKKSSIFEEVFSFKKFFNIKKFEKLDVKDKTLVEDKLNQIKKIQQDINNLLENTK